MEIKEIPQPLREQLERVKERVKELVEKYKSLANYGRPIYEDVKEVATIYYVHKKLGCGLNVIADIIKVDKTSVYNLVKKIEERNQVSITNNETKRVEIINISPQQLLEIAESMIQISAKQKIQDPFQSALIKEFWEKDVERQSNLDRRTFYSMEEKRATICVVESLMRKASEMNMPTNPDFWTREDLLKLLDTVSDLKKKRYMIKQLRRIPKWREWLKGRVGAERKFITPKMSVLFYEDYLKLKGLYKEGKLAEEEFLVLWLHITTGAREGWESEGVKYSDDLDNVKTSLIGLKWENMEFAGDTCILRIWESKTNKEWTCDLSWLDPEPLALLLKYKKEKGSIVKTLTGKKTVAEFARWYYNLCKKVTSLLNLPFKLKPHDLRRSHISILAQFKIPMEIAISGLLDFGVGWEDMTTALRFYLRFSKATKEELLNQIRERQKSYQV